MENSDVPVHIASSSRDQLFLQAQIPQSPVPLYICFSGLFLMLKCYIKQYKNVFCVGIRFSCQLHYSATYCPATSFVYIVVFLQVSKMWMFDLLKWRLAKLCKTEVQVQLLTLLLLQDHLVDSPGPIKPRCQFCKFFRRKLVGRGVE